MSPTSSQSSNLRIDYDAKTSRFHIFAPAWMVDQVRKIPNRRWDSRRRIWTAPVLRANSRHLLDHFDRDVFSGVALQVATSSIERIQSAVIPFPILYPFKTKPRGYQRDALQHAWGKNAFAFYMDMGTGKTKTSLDLMSAYYLDGRVDRVLIVTKYSTRRNWKQEIELHCGVQTDVMILDTTKSKAFDEWNTNDDAACKFLIVGTESLAAGNAIHLAEKFVLVSTRVGMIVDEAHMIKTHNAVRSQNCVKLGKSAAYKIAMTGTPIANGPMDVFMQFEYLDPNIIGIGDFYSFRNRYAIMGGFDDRQVIGYQNMEELIEMLAPFVFQVRKSEVLTELPPKIYQTREVTLNDEQKRLYKDIAKRDKTVSGDRGLTVNTVLERMLRLQEIAGGIITFERNPDIHNTSKFDKERVPGRNPKVEELLAIADENEVSTIIWCRFIEEIHMVSEALRERYGNDQVVQIYGAIDEETRWANVSDLFQSKKARFIVGNAATGGVGLNMTAAELVVYFSNSFSFTDREQSEDRAHRIGQTKSVTYIDLIAEGTVDAAVVEALRGKKNVSEFVRSSIDARNEKQLLGSLA